MTCLQQVNCFWSSFWRLRGHSLTTVAPMRDQQVYRNRGYARPLSVGSPSIFRRDAAPHPFIGWAYLHLDFQWGSRAFLCRVVGTIRPVLWGLNLGVEGRSPRNQCICVKGSRSEFLYTRILWFPPTPFSA